MNRIFILVLILFSCSQNDGTQQIASGSSTMPSELPAGAILENYQDETGVSKVLVKDNAGAIVQEGSLKDGKREGNWIEYHPGGFVKSITPFVNDLKEGMYIEIGANN